MNITLYQNDLPENHKLANAQSVAIDAESLGLNYTRQKQALVGIWMLVYFTRSPTG